MTRIAAWGGAALLAAAALADGMPELPRGKGETCVEPLDVMRRNHMDFLNHERDLTVRGGIRGRKHSLAGCIACHTQRAPAGGEGAEGGFIRIDAPGQFCHACHEFTGVKMDCFECHAAVPDISAAEDPELQFPLGRGKPDATDGNFAVTPRAP